MNKSAAEPYVAGLLHCQEQLACSDLAPLSRTSGHATPLGRPRLLIDKHNSHINVHQATATPGLVAQLISASVWHYPGTCHTSGKGATNTGCQEMKPDAHLLKQAAAATQCHVTETVSAAGSCDLYHVTCGTSTTFWV